MTGTTARPLEVLLSVIVLIAGCTPASAPTSPTSTTAPPDIVTPPALTPAATAAPTVARTVRPNAAQTGSPTATEVNVDAVVATVVDELRVRSQPRVSDDSVKYEPLLPLGTEMYILDGPVSASGYTWYEVAPLVRGLPQGWIASASREGRPWVVPDTFTCPALPTDLRTLAALPRGVGLACFPRVPITVQARLFECNCDNTPGGFFTPDWFAMGAAHPVRLVEPKATRPADDDWFELNLDPAGQHPVVLPVGRYLEGTSWSQPDVVEVTGIYDHPAAASCTFTEWDGEPVPTNACRLEFAVQRLEVVRP